jgi:hypothetical protein
MQAIANFLVTGDLLYTWRGRINQIVADVTGWFRELPGKIVSGLGDLKGAGYNFVNGFRDGFWARINEVGNEIRNAFKDLIPQSVKDALGIKSPSTVMIPLGAYTTEGFGVGAIDEAAIVGPQIGEALASNISGAVTGFDMDMIPPPSTVPGGTYAAPGGTPGGAAPLSITVNVAGSVMTERELVSAVRDGLLDIQRRNVTTGIR